MSKNKEVTQDEIGNILTLLIDTVDKDADFLNLNVVYKNTLDLNSLHYWENEIGILSHPICKILIPVLLVKATEKEENLNIGKIISFVKFILTLTIRFINKIADIKSINNLIFLACDNIDTWLLRNLNLRPIPYLNPNDKKDVDKYVRDNFLWCIKGEENSGFVYQDFHLLIELILDAKVKIQIGEKLDEYEKETIINIMADQIRILIEKARHHDGSISICKYCNCMYYYTKENKLSNQFLAMSPIENLCSECIIELNKSEYKCKNLYIKTYNKEINKEYLKYLIFSTEWSST